jgi:DNA-binding GntR family transcriptional regulator
VKRIQRSASFAGHAYARLKQLILSGELEANAVIDEAIEARSAGISRTPVREALLRLQAEGLVEIARGRGIRVKPISADQVRQLYEAITPIEAMAVLTLARRRPHGALLEPLEQALADLEAAAATGDDEAWCRADERFHRALLVQSGNPFLAQAGLQLRDRSQRAHLVAARMQSSAYKRRSTENHRALLELIRSGSPLRAARSHLRQRLRGEDALTSIFDKFGLRVL